MGTLKITPFVRCGEHLRAGAESLILTILKILAAVAIGYTALLYLLQDRLIFYPQPLSPARRLDIAKRYPAVQEIFLSSPDGVRLHAWYAGAARPARLVIYFGGNAEEVSWMLDEVRLRTPDIAWLLVDYRGYGASEGSPSETALNADALSWHDQATSFAPGQIFVFGRSLGSGVGVELASRRKVAGVILVTPFDSLVEVAKRHYPYLPVSWMLKHRFDSVSRAPALTVPLLCLVAANDEIIPAEHAKRLYDAWGGPKEWIALEGAGHNNTDGSPSFWQSIERFVARKP